MIFFTADEHYGHTNIIKYANRPFEDRHIMAMEIGLRNNSIVGRGDVVYHLGDFCFGSRSLAESYIKNLNGSHVFIKGTHDWWMRSKYPLMMEIKYEGQRITLCHYAMRTWKGSRRNTWQLYGHSHGNLEPIGKQMDVGVDCNDFYPVSFNKVKEYMSKRENNIDERR